MDENGEIFFTRPLAVRSSTGKLFVYVRRRSVAADLRGHASVS